VHFKNQKDFFSGLLFMVMGVCFAWAASKYTVGNAARMGPGYFPLLLGGVLTVLGGFIVFKALVFETEDGGRMGAWAWRPVLCIVLANLVFGALLGGVPLLHLPPMGLVPSVFLATVLAAGAVGPLRWKEGLALALLLALASYLVCTVLLKMPLAVWPQA